MFFLTPKLKRDRAIKIKNLENKERKRKKEETQPKHTQTMHLSEPQNLLCVRVKVGTEPGVNKRGNLPVKIAPKTHKIRDSTWRTQAAELRIPSRNK
ncbi:hypothetical protein TNIN_294931 [Trichonephila inaurata madagascariensis]|uniref:Uncharacterized protein n=1 Tax=Trichonephila inaurata madagascariensis TaxID=2747483 RepID=A0A8X6YFQ1_9ARAC|nr:hypothetical protein TNIN_294931 [Trichonephila inaurata madagascariensis]